jgi:hypothetical protein
MRRETILLILSVVVFGTPLLGIPYVWKDGILYTVGVFLILIAVVYRMDVRKRERSKEDMLHEEHNPGAVTPVSE